MVSVDDGESGGCEMVTSNLAHLREIFLRGGEDKGLMIDVKKMRDGDEEGLMEMKDGGRLTKGTAGELREVDKWIKGELESKERELVMRGAGVVRCYTVTLPLTSWCCAFHITLLRIQRVE